MQEAWEQHQFQRSVEDELVWAKEAETLLGTEDIGKDLQGVRFLLKNHQVKGRYTYQFALHIFIRDTKCYSDEGRTVRTYTEKCTSYCIYVCMFTQGKTKWNGLGAMDA